MSLTVTSLIGQNRNCTGCGLREIVKTVHISRADPRGPTVLADLSLCPYCFSHLIRELVPGELGRALAGENTNE